MVRGARGWRILCEHEKKVEYYSKRKHNEDRNRRATLNSLFGNNRNTSESSGLYPPSGSAVVEQTEHKSNFFFGRNEYCFDVAREGKETPCTRLLSTLYSIGALVRNDGDIYESGEEKGLE